MAINISIIFIFEEALFRSQKETNTNVKLLFDFVYMDAKKFAAEVLFIIKYFQF
jgi:hypothetical protein